MKPGWQHVKEAITTDQKNLTDDQRIHEEEKQELKSNDQDEGLIPGQKKPRTPRGEGIKDN
jgi:ribosomal protein L19E